MLAALCGLDGWQFGIELAERQHLDVWRLLLGLCLLCLLCLLCRVGGRRVGGQFADLAVERRSLEARKVDGSGPGDVTSGGVCRWRHGEEEEDAVSVVGQFFNAVNGLDDRGLVLDLSSGRSLDERLGRGPPIAKHDKTAPICCPKREEDGSGRQPVWPSGVDSKAIEDIRKKRVKKKKKGRSLRRKKIQERINSRKLFCCA